MITNRKIGNTFESEFCEMLFDKGYWVHNMAQNQAGQPADVIAVKNGKSFLIDCKACASGIFPFSRIESNQHIAMKLWHDSGNGCGWFALKLCGNDIIMLSYNTIEKLLESGRKKVNADDLSVYGISIEEWINKCE